MRARVRSRRPIPALSICIVVLVFAACGGDEQPATDTSPSNVAVVAGINDPTDPNIAVLAFMPQSVKVTNGAQVTWTIAGPEPHTVTFVGAGQPTPAPGPDAVAPIGTPGPFDGSTTVSSGLQPKGPQAFTFSLSFPSNGTYNYLCAIHPTMTGSVEVVAGAAESEQAITARGNAERDSHLAEGRAAKKTLTETPAKVTDNPDGSKTHTVLMGAATAHTAILAFQPVRAEIEAGDRVVFLNDSGLPHTATFAGTKSLPQDPESPEAMAAAPGGSPQTLNATDFFNTGWLPPNAPPGSGPPEAARSFTFNVPAAGTYAYVCLPHAPSGMAGQIAAT